MRWQVASIAAIMVASGLVSSAEACKPVPPPQRLPGESFEQAGLRQERKLQAATWDRSDLVILARVTVVQMDEVGGAVSRLDVIATLKGDLAPAELRVPRAPWSCDPSSPPVGAVVVVYAMQATDESGTRETSGLQVMRVLPIDQVRDDRVPTELRDAAKRTRDAES